MKRFCFAALVSCYMALTVYLEGGSECRLIFFCNRVCSGLLREFAQ